jgi:hypothetical protein
MASSGERAARNHGIAIAVAAAALGLTTIAGEPEAAACGACYAAQSESTVVSDHQMALALSPARTVLWDRIEYQGNPKEFAYVIPARAGTRLEASNEGWFSALDASTRPIVMAPPQSYGGGYGEGSGCSPGCGSMSTSAMAEGRAAPNGEGVTVVSEDVVGPYETVTLRATDPNALADWLTANGFDIPESSKPIIADYVKEGLDFIAMRLRPGQNVRAMQPIRIVTPGADATLPLRMMSIGAGAKLGVTLYVIGEGRYQAATFPNGTIDEDKLVWDFAQSRSSYQSQAQETMARNDGRTWLTEHAKKPILTRSFNGPSGGPSLSGSSGMLGNPGLADAYAQACVPVTYPPPPARDAGSTTDASSDASPSDASADASDDAGPIPDEVDAGTGGNKPVTSKCDDLEVALEGLHQGDVWVTRLRAFLPKAALDTPLRLEPTPKQEVYESVHTAKSAGTVASGVDLGSGARGSYALIGAVAVILASMLRRRERADT